MGQVEPALAGDQELASDRTHRVEEMHRHTGGAGGFGGHEAGRSAADDDEAFRGDGN
jgi:hypothetical protein